MRVENLRSERDGDRARICATVIWEDCDRPRYDLYFETHAEFADGLACNPHAFVLAGAIPAFHYGEKRLFIDAEICPEFRLGLLTAISWLIHWFDPSREPLVIEAKTRSRLQEPRTPERAGFFLSGGVDSFATLRTNRLAFPPEHPHVIRDGLLVYGLELDDPYAFDCVLNSMALVAAESEITLIPVYTNLYLE
jgi:hypothetical protein